jgi:hypothetical protein
MLYAVGGVGKLVRKVSAVLPDYMTYILEDSDLHIYGSENLI